MTTPKEDKMDATQHELTAADEMAAEVQALLRRETREASRRREMMSLGGLDGEAPDPYDELLSGLAQARAALDAQVAHVEFLKSHRHEYDERDYCTHCGADGRA